MRLHLLASLLLLSTPAPAQQPVAITVALDHTIAPYKPIDRWFGYDEGNYTTTPNGRALLRELHDLSPVPVTIRAHHLLTSGNGTPELKWSSTGVYSEDAQGHPVYNFAILDGIFDAYKAAGVRPMVELGFMPQDLAATVPGRDAYQVHYPKSSISGSSNNPPKDYAKWGELSRKVTEHLVQRYGRDTVKTWYFEVWNEPDIDYWHGSLQDYLKLYDFAVAGVRSALPGAIVGGPATTGPNNPHAAQFLEGFLTHIAETKSPLNFISFHAKGQPKVVDGTVTMGLRSELQDVDHGFRIIAKYPQFQHLPIILSEADPEGCAACSSKVNPANNYRNGTLYPAYTAAAYKALFALQDRHNVNLISMLSWSFEFEDRDFFEGFRDLSTNGIDKPILNLFRMTALLKGDRVQTTSTGEVPLATLLDTGVRTSPDIDAIATAAPHQAAVLLWNYHDLAELPAGTPATQPTPTTVTITGLPANLHHARLTHFRIDATHSNSYTAWQAMGSPQHPTSTQLTLLHRAAKLQTLDTPGPITVTHGTATLTTTLPRQSISCLQLIW